MTELKKMKNTNELRGFPIDLYCQNGEDYLTLNLNTLIDVKTIRELKALVKAYNIVNMFKQNDFIQAIFERIKKLEHNLDDRLERALMDLNINSLSSKYEHINISDFYEKRTIKLIKIKD